MNQEKREIEVHGIPMDLGANLRGVDMGPSALRIAGTEGALEQIGYAVTSHDPLRIPGRVTLPQDDSHAKYLGPIAEACTQLHDISFSAMQRGALPIFMGGDHSLSMGTVAGVASHFREAGEKLGLIWFDAHADMNTPETSPSGNIHGMALATLLGQGAPELVEIGGSGAVVAAENVVLLGARDVDSLERANVRESGMTAFTMPDIDQLGMAEATRRALETVTRGTAGFYLSFDLDGLDPELAPGVGTPVRGGLSFREAHLFMELVAETGQLAAMDVVELNPVRDIQNKTADVAVYLLQSALGRSIL